MKCLNCNGHKGIYGKNAAGNPATLPCPKCNATGEIGGNMQLFHVIVDAVPTLDTFSPVEVVELIMKEAKKRGGEVPVDVYVTEVK